MRRHQHNAIVVRENLERLVVAVLPRGVHRQGKGHVDASTPERMQDDLVARSTFGAGIHSFNQQVMTVRQRCPGPGLLIFQEGDQPIGRIRVEAVVRRQFFNERGLIHAHIGTFQKRRDLLGVMEPPRIAFRFPEWQILRRALGRCDEHVVVGDPFDAPGLRSHGERLPDVRFPNEFLVEFTNSRVAIHVTHVEVPTIGNRSTGSIQHLKCALPCRNRMIETIHGNTGLQFPYTTVRIPTRQHLDHKVELLTCQFPIRRTGANECKQSVQIPRLHPRHGNQYL